MTTKQHGRGLGMGVLATLVWGAVGTPPVRASGLCEDTPNHYDAPVRYSAAEQRLAFAGSQEYCDEVQKPPEIPGAESELGEERGKLHYIELRDRKNALVERLSSARGATAKRLAAVVEGVKSVPPGTLEAELKRRGYVTLPASAKSAVGGCTLRTRFEASREKQNGFPARELSLEVVSGRKPLVSVALGVAAQTRSRETRLRGLFLTEERSLLVWALVPQCIGGPPPRADDPGSCYAGDEIVIKQLTVAEQPALAGCFGPAPATESRDGSPTPAASAPVKK